MPVTSTQDFSFKLVANDVILDLFKDEAILLSDNVTGLFDLGVLPSEFTRQITLPGTKKNNAFFEHVYDISIQSPFLFETNVKVPCYLDFDGIYLADGYLQLNKVNVIANKFIDSYEVSIYGGLSSFARDINRFYLTDLTSSLAQYNHTASLANITASWAGNLLNGDIVYPLAEYGQRLIYEPNINAFGIDEPFGALSVQDFKPSIRVKKVWDAIFDTFGYTYTGSFLDEPFLNNVYMVCNNQLKYPIFTQYNLETYGLVKIGPVSGSGTTNVIIPSGSTGALLPWFNIQENPAGNMSSNVEYSIDFPSKLVGNINLDFKVKPITSTSAGYPQFNLLIKNLSDTLIASQSLTIINSFMSNVYTANLPYTSEETFEVQTEFKFNTLIPSGSYRFWIQYNSTTGGSPQFQVILDPSGAPRSFLSITKVNQGGDGLVMNIAQNLPFGTNGIKLIDFITALQKKFNLIIYPSKTKQREFIVETFNDWYKRGKVKDFNKYINLDNMIEVIPANNLAVNELNFGDTLDRDYISQQFNNLANREFGKTYYVDTQNFFSQGKFEVQSGFASSPLIQIPGTGASGSAAPLPTYFILVDDAYTRTETTICDGSPYNADINTTTVSVTDQFGNSVQNFGPPIVVTVNYNLLGCSTSELDVPITIPFGASGASYEYFSEQTLDCGLGCILETITIDCVASVTNAFLSGSSPVGAC